jgi:hypothetical protein
MSFKDRLYPISGINSSSSNELSPNNKSSGLKIG